VATAGHVHRWVNVPFRDVTGISPEVESHALPDEPHAFTVYIGGMTVRQQTERGTTGWARVVTVVAVLLLTALGVAYYLTIEPSVRIGVWWGDGVTVEQRAKLERRFLLVNGVRSETHFRYDLLDTRRENIESLVKEPNARDTESVSRTLFVAPPDIAYGQSWTWIAYRIPGLRAPGVVEALVMTCLVMLTGGIGRLAKDRRSRQD
jgi:hypothetical protein